MFNNNFKIIFNSFFESHVLNKFNKATDGFQLHENLGINRVLKNIIKILNMCNRLV